MNPDTLLAIGATLGVVGIAAGGFWAGWRMGHQAGQKEAVARALAWKNPEAWALAHGILHEVKQEETKSVERKRS